MVIVVALAFGIVNGVLYMRAFNKLKEKSGVDNFGTAGLLYLIGVFIPLIRWIGWIFAAMGFNKLKAAPAITMLTPTQPTIVNSDANQALPQLRNRKRADAIFCGNCGKPLIKENTNSSK